MGYLDDKHDVGTRVFSSSGEEREKEWCVGRRMVALGVRRGVSWVWISRGLGMGDSWGDFCLGWKVAMEMEMEE